MPPTTGGSTMGRVTSARTRDRPGNRWRARTQASGRPSAADRASAPERDLERQSQGQQGVVLAEVGSDRRPRGAQAQAHQGEHHQGQGPGGEDRGDHALPGAPHGQGAMKPMATSSCCTTPDTADCTNACAAAWLWVALTTAIG